MHRKQRVVFRQSAFTLTELLVVISIIGLMAGLISVAVPKAMEAGKKAKAKAELMAIVTAVKAYRQEYGKYPVGASKMDAFNDEFNSWYGPPTAENDSKTLMLILSGNSDVKVEGAVMNPKGVRFLEGVTTDGSVNVGANTSNGNFKDPWGTQYCVKMDSNESGGLEYYNSAGATQENLRVAVIAISLGPDKTQSDPNLKATPNFDDVFSWEDRPWKRKK